MDINIHTLKYYSAIKKNEIMSFEGKWMELEIICVEQDKPSPKSQILHVFAHLWNMGLK
jgi:hypothetical protein